MVKWPWERSPRKPRRDEGAERAQYADDSAFLAVEWPWWHAMPFKRALLRMIVHLLRRQRSLEERVRRLEERPCPGDDGCYKECSCCRR